MNSIKVNILLLIVCLHCFYAQAKNYDIVDDISTYTQRTYSEVFNKADNSWYMLNSMFWCQA